MKLTTVLRVRPLNNKERTNRKQEVVNVIDSSNVDILDPDFFYDTGKSAEHNAVHKSNFERRFSYDLCFGSQSTNEEVFEVCIRPIEKHFFDGFNCSVIAYGQTGTGKTHTM